MEEADFLRVVPAKAGTIIPVEVIYNEVFNHSAQADEPVVMGPGPSPGRRRKFVRIAAKKQKPGREAGF